MNCFQNEVSLISVTTEDWYEDDDYNNNFDDDYDYDDDED